MTATLLILASFAFTATAAPSHVHSHDAECQDLSKCPRYYNNTMGDYDPTQPEAGVTVEPELQAFFRNFSQQYIELIVKNRPPSYVDSGMVFDGLAGRALLFLRLHDRENSTEHLATAQQYIDSALNHIWKVPEKYTGFLWGRTGVYAVAAVIYDLLGQADKSADMVDKVVDIFKAAPSDQSAPNDDWDSGRAGLLYAASFLKEHFRAEVIASELVLDVAHAIVRRGISLSGTESYMEFISPIEGGRWLGQSHGSAGVLHGLFTAVPQLVSQNATVNRIVVGTLDKIVSSQQDSGNFPTEYFDATDDVLVQWDHGAPGVMSVLAEAYKLLGDEKYLASAKKAADCAWERGLVTKGLMLCHGISGNTYMQLRLGQLTNDPKYVFRALQFQRFVMGYEPLYDPSEMRQPTPNPYSMYTGSWESAVALWSDLISWADTPASARMPAYVPGV